MENVPIPAKRALAALDKPPADVDTSLPARRISKKVRTAIGYMVNGECKKITEAATKAGLARETLSRALSQPHVAEHMRQRVVRHLAIQAARAGAVKGELLDCDNEMVRDRASTFILGLADIAPASAPALSVNLNIRAGYVLDLRDPVDELPKVIPHV
jgi:phage terminase small subunit